MQYRFEFLNETKLVGMHKSTSHANDQTFELWSGFMPHKKEIINTLSTELFSLQIYPEGFYEEYNPETEFEKWAAVPVSEHSFLPDTMEPFTIPSGLYVVFDFKGGAEDAGVFFTYIFTRWLPASGYQLDNRPHFEILGDKYKNNDPESEEEIWIPVRK